MTILYLDTTSSFLYAGIIKENKVLTEVKQNLGKNMSVEALKYITEMMNDVNIKPKHINKIIIVNGPGSFTGIRIGVTIAKVIAWSMNIPITTISSLDAMAVSNNKDIYKIPVIDARRNSSYFSIYDKNNNVIVENKYATNEYILECISHLDGEYEIISNETDINDRNITAYDPDLLRIVNKFQNKECENSHNINPLYLKLTEAEENKNGGN
ncbi:MAG: tRNA (adenosine(37)-N6)-threonylcarbamoyltransferase complex dimerization subunit type 1 TsaB [Bacilli bacterium]